MDSMSSQSRVIESIVLESIFFKGDVMNHFAPSLLGGIIEAGLNNSLEKGLNSTFT